MLGDIAPLKEMVAVAKANGAMVLVDEAHSMGFIGEHGRGVAEAQGVIDDVDFIIGTFSKSVGTVGGFCVSNHPKFEILRLVCRPYVFTASLPPSVVATAATSIRKLMDSADKRAHLWENSKRLHAGLRQLGFKLGTETPQSAIIAVILPDQTQAVAMWQALLEGGLYVNMARPPATPAGMTLLRCSLCAEHSDEQVDQIIGMFERAGNEHQAGSNTNRALPGVQGAQYQPLPFCRIASGGFGGRRRRKRPGGARHGSARAAAGRAGPDGAGRHDHRLEPANATRRWSGKLGEVTIIAAIDAAIARPKRPFGRCVINAPPDRQPLLIRSGNSAG